MLHSPHHPFRIQPEQKKNRKNRRQSQACLGYAEVHPVFAGTAKPCSVSLHKNPPLRNVLGYGIANLVDNQPLMLFASMCFSGLEQTGVFPLFRLNPERMDGVDAGFIYELAHKKRMQTQHPSFQDSTWTKEKHRFVPNLKNPCLRISISVHFSKEGFWDRRSVVFPSVGLWPRSGCGKWCGCG